MTLDLIPLGLIHSLACVIALASGAYGFATRKGSAHHILTGRIYIVSMLVLNLSALGIYRLGIFFFPHMLAIATLVLIAIGWGSARLIRRHAGWRYVHLSAMILSYYMLIGGGLNEVFLRVEAARDLLNAQGPVLLGQTHGAVMLIFLVMLLGWNGWEVAKMTRRRARIRRQAAPDPAAASSR